MTKMITGLIGGMFYPLFSIIFLVIDLLQGVFYGLAGIGDIQFRNNSFGSSNYVDITATNGGDGGEKTTGLIYYLLTSDLIKNLFISILILAVFLILIFTAMAFIKNAYASKQKSWQEIVGNAFKGLANFIFIPVCCLLGIWLSNILLVAINAATSTGGSVDLSRKLFICCAYDANEFRAGTRDPIKSQEEATDLQDWARENGVTVTVQVNQDAEYYATIVDQVFAEGTVSIHKHSTVGVYYSLFNFNYVVLIVGGVFMLYVLISLAYAMIKRMFVLLMLYVISPAICAMYPLDEGSAVGNWKKEFIKYTISAYGAVAGLNLFFSILPIVQNINIISTSNSVTGVLLNDILQLLIMVSGLFVVKEFMGTLSGWIGGDNALATGSSLRSSTKKGIKDQVTSVTKKTAGAFTTAGRLHAAYKDSKDGERGFKGFVKGAGGGLLEGIKMGVTSIDKQGLNIKETFGLGYNDKGEKQTSAFKAGGKAFKDKKRGIKDNNLSEAIKKDYKAARDKFDAEGFLRDHEKDGEITNSKDVKMALLDKEMQRLDFGENERLEKMNVVGGYGSYRSVKDAIERGNKELDKRKETASKAESVAASKVANEELAQEIAKALSASGGSRGAGGGAGSTSATGTDGAVEATVRERMENQLLKRSNQLLEELVNLQRNPNQAFDSAVKNLMKFNPSGDNSSAFAQLVKNHADKNQEIRTSQVVGNVQINGDLKDFAAALDQYNSATQRKKDVEQEAKQVTERFVEEMKNSAEVAKALSGLNKEIGRTEDELKALAKTINDIAKNGKK